MGLEEQLAQWRTHLARRAAMTGADLAELEGHLRDQIADLVAAGLDEDEAFLVSVKRMGRVDEISREFAREHSERLWKQLVLVAPDDDSPGTDRREVVVVLALALGAAAVLRLAIGTLPAEVTARLASVCVLPFLAGYFAWKRRVSARVAALLGGGFVVAAAVLAAFPFDAGGDTEVLAAVHAPVVLWLLTGVAYVAGQWRSGPRRMDFIRFTGEWVVYYTLLALGGAVLLAIAGGAFSAMGVDAQDALYEWVLPMGAAGAVLVAAWLVEAKQAVVENIAPVLTLVFTPLTLALLLTVLGAFAIDPSVIGVSRQLLILMAVILVLVLGLWLYAVSARDPLARPGLFDRLQLALVLAAIFVDLVLLVAMAARIAEFGSSPNKVAALGLNLVLLVNLVRSAWLGLAFVRGRSPFAAVERWQTAYVPVYASWAAMVVVVLPPLFGFS